MKDLARVTALLLAALVLGRDAAIGGAGMRTPTVLAAIAVLLGVSLWRDGFMTFSGLALVAHYVTALGIGNVAADAGAPLVAAFVVAYLDVLDLAASVPRDRRIDRPFLLARLRHLALVVTIGAVASAAVLAVASYDWPHATAMRTAGLLAVAAAVAIPLGLARTRR